MIRAQVSFGSNAHHRPRTIRPDCTEKDAKSEHPERPVAEAGLRAMQVGDLFRRATARVGPAESLRPPPNRMIAYPVRMASTWYLEDGG